MCYQINLAGLNCGNIAIYPPVSVVLPAAGGSWLRYGHGDCGTVILPYRAGKYRHTARPPFIGIASKQSRPVNTGKSAKAGAQMCFVICFACTLPGFKGLGLSLHIIIALSGDFSCASAVMQNSMITIVAIRYSIFLG
jgi:hypothetical protein